VIPIPKPNRDHSDQWNYRPINYRIINWVSWAAHSALHQFNRVVRHVKNRTVQEMSTGMLFLDVERAFDSVWHDALLHKLILRDCNIFLFRIIYPFFNYCTFQVIVG
jgi:hypothetical protein